MKAIYEGIKQEKKAFAEAKGLSPEVCLRVLQNEDGGWGYAIGIKKAGLWNYFFGEKNNGEGFKTKKQAEVSLKKTIENFEKCFKELIQGQ
jgi:hypothetical protein